MQRFRGGLVFEAYRLLYHSTLGLRITKKKRLRVAVHGACFASIGNDVGGISPLSLSLVLGADSGRWARPGSCDESVFSALSANSAHIRQSRPDSCLGLSHFADKSP